MVSSVELPSSVIGVESTGKHAFELIQGSLELKIWSGRGLLIKGKTFLI